MISRKRKLLSVVCAAVAAGSGLPAHGEGQSSVFQNLVDRGWQIRKSFSGSSKESGLPAAFSFENPDQGPDYRTLDVGLKLGTYLEDQMKGATNRARIYPTLEIHRSSRDSEEIKKTAGGITFEYERAINPKVGFGNMLFADGKIEIAKDSVLDETTQTFTLRGGWYNNKLRYGPGRAMRFAGDQLVVRWLPTIGVEDYRKLPIKAKVNGESVVIADAVDTGQAFIRMNVVVHPFTESLDSRFVVTAGHTVRRSISGDDFFGKTTHLTEASADIYLDNQRYFSVGLSYQKGRDPSRNFLDEEFSSLGFKLKLGG